MTTQNTIQIDHPLIRHHLSILRNQSTDSARFRSSLKVLTTLLAFESCSDLQEDEREIETPLTSARCRTIRSTIGLVPILRAGIGMVEPMLDLIPTAEVWHLGLYREEETARAVSYYNKLPPHRTVDLAMILDPMLATGGSILMAVDALTGWGVKDIRVLSIISAPEGLAAFSGKYPHISVFTCSIDKCLDENKFIVPGLGDAGDRIFNTR